MNHHHDPTKPDRITVAIWVLLIAATAYFGVHGLAAAAHIWL